MNLFQLEIYNNPILTHTPLEKVSKGKKEGLFYIFKLVLLIKKL
jgi:hypothetical protein